MKSSGKLVLRWSLTMIAVAVVMIGCGSNGPDDEIRIKFQFKDAKAINVGARVMGDGIKVGKVIAPPESPEPGKVLIKVEIDNISREKKRFLTNELSAEIKKDSLVAGEGFINLIFPAKPGQPVPDGTVLPGKDLKEVAPGISVPTKSGQQVIKIMMSAFGVSSAEKTGQLVFFINWGSIVILALVLLALLIDFIIRLPQGKDRERSSPKLLRAVWSLFVICLLLKLVLFVMQALAIFGIIPISDNRWIILPTNIAQLASQQAGFWAFAFILIGFRFKMQLLMKVK